MKQMFKELWVLVILGILVCGIFTYQLEKRIERRYENVYQHQEKIYVDSNGTLHHHMMNK